MKTISAIYALLTEADPIGDIGTLDTRELIGRVEAELGYRLAEPTPAQSTKERIMVTQQSTTPRTPTPTPAQPPRSRRGPLIAFGTAVVALLIGLGIAYGVGVFDPEPDVADPPTDIDTVEAITDAYNTYDAVTYAGFWAPETQGPGGVVVGSTEWDQWMSEEQARGAEMAVSGCESISSTVRCLETYQEGLLSGKAGIVLTWEAEYTFNDEGQIIGFARFDQMGAEEIGPFEAALGRWMATAHPEVFETYYVPDFYTRLYENWYTPDGAAQLSTLIDEFIAQSSDYPLNS